MGVPQTPARAAHAAPLRQKYSPSPGQSGETGGGPGRVVGDSLGSAAPDFSSEHRRRRTRSPAHTWASSSLHRLLLLKGASKHGA